jgi:hypothetical protein
MYAESGCNSQAKNLKDNHKVCYGSFGLMQISCDYKNTLDAKENIRIAYEEKYNQKDKKGNQFGYSHWSVCKRIDGKPPLVNCKKSATKTIQTV